MMLCGKNTSRKQTFFSQSLHIVILLLISSRSEPLRNEKAHSDDQPASKDFQSKSSCIKDILLFFFLFSIVSYKVWRIYKKEEADAHVTWKKKKKATQRERVQKHSGYLNQFESVFDRVGRQRNNNTLRRDHRIRSLIKWQIEKLFLDRLRKGVGWWVICGCC